MNFANPTAPTPSPAPIICVPMHSLVLWALLAIGFTLALDATINRGISPAQTQPAVPAHYEPGMHELRAPQFIFIHATVKEAKV
jgi:hypothetical protein